MRTQKVWEIDNIKKGIQTINSEEYAHISLCKYVDKLSGFCTV